MPDGAYWPGQQLKLRLVVTSSSEVEVNSTGLTLLWWRPDGTCTTKQSSDLTQETTGTYYYLVVPTSSQTGEWVWRCTSTGSVVGASAEGRFKVLAPKWSTG